MRNGSLLARLDMKVSGSFVTVSTLSLFRSDAVNLSHVTQASAHQCERPSLTNASFKLVPSTTKRPRRQEPRSDNRSKPACNHQLNKPGERFEIVWPARSDTRDH